MRRTIGEIARFVTSKNAGPFLLTLDVVFPDEVTYRRFKALGALDRATVARLYGIKEDDVLKIIEFDPAYAMKVTLIAYLDNVRTRVAETYPPDGYRLLFHIYGRLVIDVIADDPDASAAILALARSVALHVTYPGRKAIAGNLASPFSPSDLKAGDAYEFNVHRLVTVDDPLELFPIKMVEA